MFNSMPQVAKKAMTLAANGRKFITGEPNKLYYGTLSLKQYLEENGERDAFIIRNLLKEQNWRAFESAYSHTGRAPYAPMAMMGLIVLAIINGVHSLRGIKKFARFNLAAQWVSGGICPQYKSSLP